MTGWAWRYSTRSGQYTTWVYTTFEGRASLFSRLLRQENLVYLHVL